MSIAVRTDTGVPLEAKLSLVVGNIGGVRFFSENDPGERTGTALLKSPETSADYRLRVGTDSLQFSDLFNAAAQNTGLYKHLFTTMTMTQGTGGLLCNANSTATTATGCLLQTWLHFPLHGASGLYAEFPILLNAVPLAGQVFTFGLGLGATATAEPTDGVYLRVTSAGIYLIAKFNGSEVIAQKVGDVSSGAETDITLNQITKALIVLNQREVQVWVDDEILATVPTPQGQAQMSLSGSLPAFIQQFNSGAVTGSPQLQARVGGVNVSMADLDLTRKWSQALCAMGLAYQGLNGGTMGTLAKYPNATGTATATAAVPTNTTAALGSGLGGEVLHTNTLAINTDGILLSYQNPAGGAQQTPRNLVITGAKIDSVIQVALANTAAALYQFGIAWGHTSVSLATAESASFANNTAKAPRRRILGMVGAVGALAPGAELKSIDRSFEDSPIVVAPGGFVAIFVKNIGTVGTAGVIAHAIDLAHHFE